MSCNLCLTNNLQSGNEIIEKTLIKIYENLKLKDKQ